MARVDLFCVPEDRHRVILLVDLLERAGQSVTLHTEPVAGPTDPLLIACSSSGLRRDWMADLFRAERSVVAVRLDDTPLPGPCNEVIDLQSWPARSADSKVGGLVRLLQSPSSARRLRGVGRSASKAGNRAGNRNNWLGVGLVIGFAALAVLVLWAVAPDPDPPAEDAPAGLEPNLRPEAAVPMASDSVAGSSTDPLVESATGTPAASADAGAAAVRNAVGAAVVAPAPRSPDGEAPPPVGNGSIAHLCRADSLEAARAWLSVLDWRQRRQLESEPCFARLIARPDFEALAALLEHD